MSLRNFSILTAVATLVLIAAGGLVTSHGVGLSVPDWPNTYGYNMFFFPFSQWVGGIFYEHSHRLIGSGVGLLTSILALWLHGPRSRPLLRWGGLLLGALGLAAWAARPDRWTDAVVLLATGASGFWASFHWPKSEPAPRWLRHLGVIAFVAVVIQGVLGGVRVTAMKDEIGIFHAALAQLFFTLVCAIALFTTAWWKRLTLEPPSVPRWMAGLISATTVLIFAQLALGATMRHAHAGLAIPDFPLAYGKLWPATDPTAIELYNQQRLEITAVRAITAGQVVLQMAHRLGAALILGLVAAAAGWAWRGLPCGHPVRKLTAGWAMLILVQAGLGAFTIWSNKAADIATAHVVAGALSLATGAITCIVSLRLLAKAPAKAAVPPGMGAVRLRPQTSPNS